MPELSQSPTLQTLLYVPFDTQILRNFDVVLSIPPGYATHSSQDRHFEDS